MPMPQQASTYRMTTHRSQYTSDWYDEKRTGRSKVAFKQPLINHIVFVIDGSSSMGMHKRSVIKVIEGQIAYLARRSKELGQETRVTVYVFADGVECLVYDVDVLRLPEIGTLYEPYGNTALVGATMRALKDLEATSQIHGDHSFLLYVLSDGQENASFDEEGYRYDEQAVSYRVNALPDNWTVAGLVPDQVANWEAQKFGFPKENLSVWDASSATGMDEVGAVVNTATEAYLVGRAQGVRGSKTIFSTGSDTVNKKAVQATLQPLAGDKYRLIPVTPEGAVKGTKVRVDKFVKEDCGMPFRLGTVYYQWNKTEKVQPQKRLAVVDKRTDRVYVGTGDEIRQMIGLPSMSVTQKATPNPDFDVFVQSTAPNRNLLAFTRILVML